MDQKIKEMTRAELMEKFEELGGDLKDLGSGYIRISVLRKAVAELLDKKESVASLESDFTFVDVREAEATIEEEVEVKSTSEAEPAKPDKWYIERGLPIPRE